MATKTPSKEPSKDAKPAAAAVKSAPKTAKVMDVVHPGQTAATPTSRPVIVPSRPMMNADPMLSKDETSTDEAPSQSAVGRTPAISRQEKQIKPLTDIDAAAEAAVASAPEEEPAMTPQESTPEESAKADVPASEEIETTEEAHTDQVTTESAAGERVLQPPVHDETEPVAKDEPGEVEPESNQEEEPAKPELTPETVPEDVDKDIVETEEALQAKTAEQVRQEELEALVQKGTYHVPINHVARTRAAVVFTTLLVIVLVLAILDLLLDMGLLKISGIPHTTFFSI